MLKEFNITGVCVPQNHFMVNLDNKINQIIKLIDQGKYFSINRARQYGKTTFMNQLAERLRKEYVVLEISFEGLGGRAFSSEVEFCDSFINLIYEELLFNSLDDKVISRWIEGKKDITKLEELSRKISRLVEDCQKEIVLMIDEVDKNSDNQLFLHFLGMLRNKYLKRSTRKDKTFKSVILAGVYDIKNLRVKLCEEGEIKYNSPWNIAANFTVDMAFSPEEISTMLADYRIERVVDFDITLISNNIYEYTKGYPFLVSRICKLIHEDLHESWTAKGIEEAVKKLLKESNTLFDDIIKNIENNKQLDELIYNILLNGIEYSYVQTDPIVQLGSIFGIFTENHLGKIQIHNKIFELLIYNHYSMRVERGVYELKHYISSQFIDHTGNLKMDLILDKFQELMIQEYREKDQSFLEREGRLLFLAFIKPIINGKGFYFVETQTRNNLRLDIVVVFNNKRYIVELKKWYGKQYEERGLDQLCEYLEIMREKDGYMIMFDSRKEKEYKKNVIETNGKKIYEIVV